MSENKKTYGRKSPVIVKNKIVLEEITFKGKKIMREKVVKEWNIPKIITGDIGYQLMFGWQCAPPKPTSHNNMEEYDLGEMIKNQY